MNATEYKEHQTPAFPAIPEKPCNCLNCRFYRLEDLAIRAFKSSHGCGLDEKDLEQLKDIAERHETLKPDHKLKPEFALDTVMTYGKHKGSTIQFLVDNEIEYIEWLISEGGRMLNNEAFRYYMRILGTREPTI